MFPRNDWHLLVLHRYSNCDLVYVDTEIMNQRYLTSFLENGYTSFFALLISFRDIAGIVLVLHRYSSNCNLVYVDNKMVNQYYEFLRK